MKVKNLMFSGFAAAIFAGVFGGADAATYNLASKNYVDTEIDKVDEAIAKKQDTLTAGSGITINKDETTGVLTIDTKQVKIGEEEVTVQEAIADVQTQIGTLPEGTTSVAEGLETLSGTIGALPEGTTVAAELESLSGTIGTLPEGTESVAAALSDKEDVANKVSTATAESIKGMGADEKAKKYPSIAVAETIASAAVTEVNKVAGDLSTLQTQVNNNITDIADLKQADTDMDGRVDSLETTVNDATNGLSKKVADLETTVNNETSGLSKKVTDLETTVNDTTDGLSAKVTALETTVNDTTDGLSAKVTALETTVNNETSGLSKKVADLESSINDGTNGLSVKITDVSGRVDTLEDDVDGLQTLVGEEKVADQIDAKINALDLANKYDAKGAAADVQTAVNNANYVSANDILNKAGGYMVKSDGEGNISMLDVAIVDGDGTKDLITGADIVTVTE